MENTFVQATWQWVKTQKDKSVALTEWPGEAHDFRPIEIQSHDLTQTIQATGVKHAFIEERAKLHFSYGLTYLFPNKIHRY